MRLLYVFLPLALMLCSVSLKAQLTWEFVNELSDGNLVEVSAVEADVPRSCIYVTGSCVGDMSSAFTTGLNGTPDFSISYGGRDGFVAKYLTDGTFVWAFRIGGANDDRVNDVAVDLNGDIYITGGFIGSIDFKGTETISSLNTSSFGAEDIFYAKYDLDGKVQWHKEEGGGAADAGERVEVLNSNVFFAGEYQVSGSTEIGGATPFDYSLGVGGIDIFLVSMDLSGVLLWNADAGSPADDQLGGVAVENDSVYLVVNYNDVGLMFRDSASNMSFPLANGFFGTYNAALCSFSSLSGLFGWTEQISGNGDELVNDVIANGTSLILTGTYNAGIVIPSLGVGPNSVMKYSAITITLDNNSGAGIWYEVEQTVGGTDAVSKCLSFDQSGNIIVAGEFSGTLDVQGTYLVSSAGVNDLYTIAYDNSGAYLFHDSASSVIQITVNDLAIDGSNGIHFVGENTSNVIFGSNFTSSSGFQDGYCAKLSFCDASFSYASNVFCSGNPNEVPVISGDVGGVFTELSGNVVFTNSSTGEIDLTGSAVGGPYSITYTAPNGCQEIQFVTILLNAPPVFTFCPNDTTVSNDNGVCSANVTYSPPVSLDDCGLVSILQTDLTGLTSTDDFPVGIHVLEYTATDLAGNTSICSFSVTVDDEELPVINCPADITQGTTPGTCGASVTFSPPVGTDNCPVAITSQLSGSTSGSVYPVGTTVNTFEVVDLSDNTASCSFSVTINDLEGPSITCPSDIVQSNDSSFCNATVNFTTPTGTDNCSGSNTVQLLGFSSGSSFPVGTTVNSFIVTDASGLSSSCSFNVIVNDDEFPFFTSCPADIVQNTDLDTCGAIINYSVPIASDNCGGLTVSLGSGSLPSGSYFPIGTTTVLWEATDAAGNSAICSFTVTIIDNQVPTIICPMDIVKSNDPAFCGAICNYSDPIIDDNCSASLNKIDTTGLFSGDFFPLGTTELIYAVEDPSGNFDTCSFLVIVNDDSSPVFSNCVSDTVLNNDFDSCGAVFNFPTLLAEDNCGILSGPNQIDTSGLSSGDLFPIGVNTITYAVVDSSGNTDTCSFVVTVNDVDPPVLACITDTTLNSDTGTCGAVFNFSLPTVTDNCDTIFSIQRVDTTSLISGDVFPVGITELIFAVADNAGNTDSCSFLVTVFDVEAPVITLLSDIVVTNDIDSCGAIINFTLPPATDNCTTSFDTLKIDGTGLNSGDLFPIGITTLEYVYLDEALNSDTCQFNVTVSDTQSPVFTVCPSTVVVNNDSAMCGAVVTYAIPLASDNCAVDSIYQKFGETAVGSYYDIDTTVNTWYAIDAFGNVDSCSFLIIVLDAEPPSAPPYSLPSIVPNDSALCGAVVNYATPAFFDNCPANLVITQTVGDSSGSFFPVDSSAYYVTFEATDGVYTFVRGSSFSVIDNEPPVISCLDLDTILYVDSASCSVQYFYEAPTPFDNCGIIDSVKLILGDTSGYYFPLGIHELKFETWAPGGSHTCSAIIEVRDTIKPQIICPGDTTGGGLPSVVLCDSIFTDSLVPVYSDNCPMGLNLFPIPPPFYQIGDTLPIGISTLSYNAADSSNNISTCAFTVEVLEPIFPYWDSLPVEICLQADVIRLDSLTNGIPGVFSGAGVDGYNLVPSLAGVGAHYITFTVENEVCLKDSTMMINVLPNPEISAGEDDSICGLNYTLNGSSTMEGFWSSTSFTFGDITDTLSSIFSAGFDSYECIWQITAPLTCEASDTVTIRFDEQISVYAGEDQYVLEDLQAYLTAEYPTNGVVYWDVISGFGEVLNVEDPNSEFIPNGFGIYELSWIGQNGSCPVVTDEVLLEFRKINIPQGLSPNADGLNDQFIIPGISQFEVRNIKVYDRWGKVVYSSESYNNDWSGTNFNGSRLIDDTYFYEITLDAFTFTGFVLVKN
ncbi:MAG: HYR domain-containing protein [Flavobacteriales bacterium]|nr:HYR domain-containing protein [Flavobacteriales bacterium]